MNQLKTVHTTGYLSVIQNYAIEKAGLKKRGVGDEVNDWSAWSTMCMSEWKMTSHLLGFVGLHLNRRKWITVKNWFYNNV